jgi:hypothetical protein
MTGLWGLTSFPDFDRDAESSIFHVVTDCRERNRQKASRDEDQIQPTVFPSPGRFRSSCRWWMGLTEMLHDRPYTTLLQPLDVRRCDDPGEVRIFGEGFERITVGVHKTRDTRHDDGSTFGTLLTPLLPRMGWAMIGRREIDDQRRQSRTHSTVQRVPDDIHRRP